MKNNRLTNEDMIKLRMACDRIRNLASLENASFSFNKEKDIEIKKAILPYMEWFNSISYSIESLLNGEDVDYLYFR